MIVLLYLQRRKTLKSPRPCVYTGNTGGIIP